MKGYAEVTLLIGVTLVVSCAHHVDRAWFSLDWLNGDWSAFTSLRIIARIRVSGPTRIFPSVWDGKGPYDFDNRFQRSLRSIPAGSIVICRSKRI